MISLQRPYNHHGDATGNMALGTNRKLHLMLKTPPRASVQLILKIDENLGETLLRVVQEVGKLEEIVQCFQCCRGSSHPVLLVDIFNWYHVISIIVYCEDTAKQSSQTHYYEFPKITCYTTLHTLMS